MPWAPPGWDDYISSIIGPPPNPLANDPEPGSSDPTTDSTFLPAMPATPEALTELRQQKVDEAFAKGTGPYPEGARTDVARIAQSTGPTGTIGQIGREGFGGQQEAPLGWEGLSPVEESQIEIDGLQTPPMLGEVDAVSGGGPTDVSGVVDVTGEDREQPKPDLLAPSDDVLPSAREREDQQSAEQLAVDMSKQSPEEQAMFLAKIQASKDNFAASRALEESNKAAEQAAELARIRDEAAKKTQARRVELEAEAKKIADTDPTSTIPGYKKVLGVLSAFIGGFAANKTGRNMGLEVVDQIANDAAQQQAQKLGLVKGQIAGLGDDIAAADTAYRNGEIVRIATYDAAIKALQAEVQLYDPKGTIAANTLQTMQQLAARRADAIAKYEQQTFENELKARDSALKSRDQGLKEAKYLSDEQRKAAAAGGGQKYKPEYFTALRLPTPPWEMSEKEHKAWMGGLKTTKDLNKGPGGDKSEDQLRKEAAEATKAEAEASAFKSGFQVMNPTTGKPFLDEKGEPIAIKDDKQRNELISGLEAAARLRRLADRMSALLAKNGGNWKVLGSDEAQELESYRSAIDFTTFKAFGLGAPSEGDKELAVGGRGGVDPSSFVKNATKGLQTYADSVEKMANDKLRLAGYRGPTLRFPRDSDLKQAPPTVVDDIGRKLTSSLLKTEKKTDNPLAAGVQKYEQLAVAPQNKETEALFDQLAAYAEQPNDMGDLAKNYLRELAAKAVHPDAKVRAKAILDGLPGAGARTDEAR